MEEEDGRKIGVKSRPNRRRPRKAGVKFFLVCLALLNFFFFERSGKKVQTDDENEKNTSLRTINLSGPPNLNNLYNVSSKLCIPKLNLPECLLGHHL